MSTAVVPSLPRRAHLVELGDVMLREPDHPLWAQGLLAQVQHLVHARSWAWAS